MSRTTQILIGVVASVAVAAAYWMLVISPKRDEATKLSTKIAVAQAQLTQTQATLADYQKAKAAYKANYMTYVGLGKAAPAADDTRSLLVQLDAAAKRSGVAFNNFDVLASESTTNGTVATTTSTTGSSAFTPMPFNLTFAGSFQTLGTFLGRLERFVTTHGDQIEVNGRLVRIDSISLAPGATGWPQISAQLAATTFLAADQSGAAATAAASQTPGGATTTATAGSTTTPSTTTTTNASDLR